MGFITTTDEHIASGGTISGDLTIDADLSVTGSTAITTNEVIQGTSIIDISNTEALLVRKNSDGGDVFTVDTTNSEVELGVDVKLKIKDNDYSGQLSINSSGYTELQALGDRSIDLKSQRQIRMYTSDDGASYTQALNLSSTGGNATFLGNVTVGADGSGKDVTFYSATAGDSFAWDASEEKLTITGTNGQTALDVADGNLVVADNVDIEGDIDVNGTTNLDAVDIDGAVQIDSTLTVGVDDTGQDVKFFGATSGKYMLWDESGDDLIVNGAIGINGTPSYDLHIAGTRVQVDGDTPIIVLKDTSAYSQNTGAQLVFQGLDSASATRDFGYIQGSSRGSNDGALDFYTRGSGTNALRMRIDEGGDVSIGGDLDIDGTTNLDNVDIDGTFTQDAGNVVFNEDSGDYDFRIESNGNANMLYVDGGNDRIGVGAAPAEATFEVAGTSGEISKFGTLTNDWAANHAFGVANGTGIMISDLDAANNTAANRVIGLQRDDTNGHSIFIYDPAGNADIGLRANNTSYIKGGFLGLGHSSPIVNLDVHADTAETAAVFGQADDGNCYIATRTGEVQNNVCGYVFQVGSAALTGYGSANTLATITSTVKNDGGTLKGNLAFSTNQGDSLGGGTTTMEITEEGVVDLTKGQLKFPATQNASTDANTLDDYEEGVFEVAVTGQTSGSWSTNSVGGYVNYVKIGQLCHVSGYIQVDNESSPSGNVKITLPFTSCTGLTESADLQWGFGSISHGGSTVSGMTSMAYIPENSNFFLLSYVQDDGTFSYFTDANVDDTWIARIGFTYRTNG